ncbi:AIR synthase, partial [Clavibacter michiganensis]
MGPPVVRSAPAFLVSEAEGRDLGAYRRLRHDAFVEEQGIFAGTDLDALDEDPRTVVLVARAAGEVVGGVRLAPVGARDIGWWTGSRLVVAPGA